MEALSKTTNHLPDCSDNEWRDLIIESLSVPDMQVGGVTLPGFPSQEIATLTTAAGATEGILRGAYNLYKLVKESSVRLGKPIDGTTKFLDFGCGWGRVARFFLKDIYLENVYGVDVLEDLTDSCATTFASENFTAIQQKGTLPFEDNSFDLILAYSVFSHLDPELGDRWIREIHRVLGVNGIAYITIIDESKFDVMVQRGGEWFNSLKIDHVKAKKSLARGKTVWQSTNRQGELQGYGLAILPLKWIEKSWKKYFVTLDVITEYSQTILVLQKR